MRKPVQAFRNDGSGRIRPSVGATGEGSWAIAVSGLWIYNTNVYLRRHMQVSKWGNSLAIRLPAAVVEALELKEGDDIEIQIANRKNFQVKKGRTREQALA